MLLLIALGGNAVGRPGEEGNIPQQFAATRAAMRPVADLILAGHRVVPSPIPREIVELDLMKTLVAAGKTIVAAGGGGIPVMRDDHGNFKGIEAVIDKDRTSALLAAQLGADQFLILTAVDQVQRDF